ncbi:hypothetical protein P7C73_g5762, partial [Tremellales sp. Uapishka_1]
MDRSGDVPQINISHPYPPSYRSHSDTTPPRQVPPPTSASVSPQTMPYENPFQSRTHLQNPFESTTSLREHQLSPAGSTTTRPRSDSTTHLNPTPYGHDEKKSIWRKSKMDPNVLPVGWTKEDEEAEKAFLEKGMFDWKALMSWKYWVRREWVWYYVALVLISVLVILMSVYHDQIVDWLRGPATWVKEWVRFCHEAEVAADRLPSVFQQAGPSPSVNTPRLLAAGRMLMAPAAILFVLSFPPLFGHERYCVGFNSLTDSRTVLIRCTGGLIYGVWIGFAIVAAGTFLGEVGNFYAFKYCCRSRAEKTEKTNMNYACMAHVVREGGFFIIFVARLSAIPGHFTTAVFATCGMNIFVFILAAILSSPKQFSTVYLGVILDSTTESSKDKIISDAVLGVSFFITTLAAWYIYREMSKARVFVWRKERMAMKADGSLGASGPSIRSKNRKSYIEYLEGPELDEEARSPILPRATRPGHQAKQSSYENSYDISYNRDDDMSVYHIEPMTEYDNPSFPQAKPAGVRREPSAATTYHPRREEGLEFPVPLPLPSLEQGSYVHYRQ